MITISHRKLCRGGGASLVVLIAAAAVLLVAFAGVRLVGLTPYAVLSGSMEPEYPVGSLVYVKAVDPLDVEVGDAITFSLPSGTLVTHQVYQIDAESRAFRTQASPTSPATGPLPRRRAGAVREPRGQTRGVHPVSGLHQRNPHFSAGSCDCRDGYRRFSS